MDRFLILSFVASHEGDEIRTLSKDSSTFIMETNTESMLVKKEDNGSVISSLRTKENPTVINHVYYPNGILQLKCEILGKNKHGYHLEYYPSGNLYIDCRFHENKLHGLETKYHENGQKNIETNYQHGIIDGTQYVYSEGIVKIVNTLVQGILVLTQECFPNGTVKIESQVLNSKLHGEAREYHENGICKRVMFLKEGFPHGKESRFDSRGKIHSYGKYVNGQKDGDFCFVNTLGKITHIEKYVNGVRV